MEMPLLKVDDFYFDEQYKKIKEEFQELQECMYQTHEEISEALDLITATMTYITHTFDKYQIQAALTRHQHKLDERGWRYKGKIKIELEDAE